MTRRTSRSFAFVRKLQKQHTLVWAVLSLPVKLLCTCILGKNVYLYMEKSWDGGRVWPSLNDSPPKKAEVLHHTDWLNYIHGFSFTASYSLCFVLVPPPSRPPSDPPLHLSHSFPLHSSSPALKGVRPDVDGEPEGGAGLVVALVAEQRVHRHHLQVQRVFSGPRHGTGQHQHCTDVIDLLQEVKPYKSYTGKSSFFFFFLHILARL